VGQLNTQVGTADASGLALLFWLRHDFPTEWAAFVNTSATTFTMQLDRRYFPYFAQGKKLSIDKIEIYNGTAGPTSPSIAPSDVTSSLATGPATLVLDKVPHDPAAQVFLLIKYSIT
jgi:hypothetical protein